MKSGILSILIIIILASTSAYSGSNAGNQKLSPKAQILLKYLSDNDLEQRIYGRDPELLEKFMLYVINDSIYAGALIKFNEVPDNLIFEEHGVLIGTIAGDIYSVKIPLRNLDQFVSYNNIKYLQVDEPIRPFLNNARSMTNVDEVQAGEDIPYYLSGQNVVIGMIDAGFDYTHPNFLNNSGTNTRILKVWEQNSSGTPPQGYLYGKQINQSQLPQEGTDNYQTSHGTHTAGITSGAGFRNASQFKGIAPQANLVLVSYTLPYSAKVSTGQSSIVDAINYIFKTAASLGKPAVINMSIGHHVGPHDGFSLFDQASANLTGPGKILVGAMGNTGDINLHILNDFSSATKEIKTFPLTFLDDEQGNGIIDIWGEQNSEFCVKISVMNGSNETASSETVCTNKNGLYSTQLNGSVGIIGMNIVTTNSEFNGKPRIYLEYANNTGNDIMLTITGTKGKVHAWNCGSTSQGADFLKKNYSWATPGDPYYCPAEIGGSNANAITVGAYSSKREFIDRNNNLQRFSDIKSVGEIAYFSAYGPTVDGVTKPDICAPGNAVTSSVNSFDDYYKPDFYTNKILEYCHDYSTYGKYYCYGPKSGTSMSTPVVTGIIALFLEADPNLTMEQARNIIRETAITDIYTGSIQSDKGDNLWGWGKINALAGVKKVFEGGGQPINSDLKIYPNPSSGEFSIEKENVKNNDYRILITDIMGRELFSLPVRVNNNILRVTFKHNNLAIGIYLVRVSGPGFEQFGKIEISNNSIK